MHKTSKTGVCECSRQEAQQLCVAYLIPNVTSTFARIFYISCTLTLMAARSPLTKGRGTAQFDPCEAASGDKAYDKAYRVDNERGARLSNCTALISKQISATQAIKLTQQCQPETWYTIVLWTAEAGTDLRLPRHTTHR